MKEKYSVFLGNVGSCSDRYCAAYGKAYSWEELFERAASVPYLSGVDLVLTPELLESFQEVRGFLKTTGLKPVSLAVDHFTQAKWKQGTLSSVDPSVRKEAVQDTMRAMDLAAEIGCGLVTVWPGQDGYDYLFQADYIRERTLFADGIREACRHRPDIRISLEYKAKEPRSHCYVNSTATTLLMIQERKTAGRSSITDMSCSDTKAPRRRSRCLQNTETASSMSISTTTTGSGMTI